MKTLAGDNVRDIIRKYFDERMAIAVVSYILDNGWENVKQITEEEILTIKGNALMTDVFTQALVRTAVKICKETNQFDDFLPFIINCLHVPKAATKSLDIYKNEVSDYHWENLLEKLGLDYEEDAEKIVMIELNANVLSLYKED